MFLKKSTIICTNDDSLGIYRKDKKKRTPTNPPTFFFFLFIFFHSQIYIFYISKTKTFMVEERINECIVDKYTNERSPTIPLPKKTQQHLIIKKKRKLTTTN